MSGAQVKDAVAGTFVGLVCPESTTSRALGQRLEAKQIAFDQYESLDAVLGLKASNLPRLLVVDVAAIEARHKVQLQQFMEAKPVPGRVIAISQLSENAAKTLLVPLQGVCVVAGGPRFAARAMKTIAEMSPTRQATRVPLTLLAWVSQGTKTESVTVENLSESGARLFGGREFSLGERLTLVLELGGRPALRIKTAVVHAYSEDDVSWHTGVRYLELTPDAAQGLADLLVHHGPDSGGPKPFKEARVAPRLRLPRKLAVKVRVSSVADGRRYYLSVVDISESGFQGASTHPMKLTVGERFTFSLMWAATSVSGQCELMRTEPVEGAAARANYGFRFVSNDGDRRVSYLSQLARELGLRNGR